MSEISKLPWSLAANGCHVYDAGGNIIASVALDGSWGDVNDREANAAYIVKCVNAFPTMVEALKKCRHELNVIRARDGVPYTHYHMKSDVDEQYFSDVIDEAEAALAQAEGVER